MQKFVFILILNLAFAIQVSGLPDRLYTKRDGLEGTFFYDVLQDNHNFVWICTMSGLTRFDSYNFKAYRNQPEDTASLNSSYTLTVFQDYKDNLWVGTSIGLNKYQFQSDDFNRIKLKHNNIEIKTPINKIIQYKDDFLYLFSDNGLILFNTSDNTHKFYNTSFESNSIPSYNQFFNGCIDNKGNIWIATSSLGVLIFNPNDEKFHPFKEYKGSDDDIPFEFVRCIKKIGDTNIYIGGLNGEVVVYNEKDNSIQNKKINDKNNNKKIGGIISFTELDNEVWIGTEYAGVYKTSIGSKYLNSANHLFNIDNMNKASVRCNIDNKGNLWFGINYIGLYHQLSPSFSFESHTVQNSSLKHHLVRSIITDNKGDVLIGTDGGGAAQYNFTTNTSITLQNKFWNPSAVLSLFKDKKGNIWVGSYNDGLACIKRPSNKIVNYPLNFNNKKVDLNWIYDIEEGKNGILYIATNGSGLIKFNPIDETYSAQTKFKTNYGGIELINYINDLIVEENGDIWFATYDGLFKWDEKNQYIIRFKDTYEIFINNPIYCIEKGFDNNILIGTFNGYFEYDYINKTLNHYTTDNGLSNNMVTALIPYKKNEVWLSTSNGISKFNSTQKSFKNYNQYDGLPFNEFLRGAKYLDNDGYIYFGGVNGFIKFHPDSLIFSKNTPKLYFTDFKVLNKQLNKGFLGDRKLINKNINNTDTINLRFSDKTFSISFAAIDYRAPEKIKYTYQLDGFDKNWIETDFNYRTASYSNLEPGIYNFKLKSSDINGQWLNNLREISIVITPPFWLTWWAFAIYFIFINGLFLLIFYIYRFRLTMKSKIHIEQVERQKQADFNQAKFQFFTNISHDIRTPLSMIFAPLEALMKTNLTSDQQKYTSFIHRNTKRMQRLINQLLEIQKIDNTKISLNYKSFEINSLINDIVALFETNVKDKSIKVLFKSSVEERMLIGDVDKIDKVIYNVVSNAFKYTPNDGEIIIYLSKIPKIGMSDFDNYEICISDSGIGIKPENTHKIFDRFFQESSTKSSEEGTGIGLHIAKKLIEAINGTIEVESKLNKGTKFKIVLPLKPSIETDNIADKQKDTRTINTNELKHINQQTKESNNPTIIVVEDDNEILSFIKNELSNDYNVVIATNGKDAWEIIQNKSPKLVLSDITMPGMDGIELCKLIKTTFETSHIPVILLTARIAQEHEVKGLQTGADAYVHKPFNLEILKVKIQTTIEAREKLKASFSRSDGFVAKEMTVTSPDELFLQQAMDYVKENLENSNLTVDKMCVDLSISRVHLYRKIKALTNQAPTEFIRIIRLKQAAYLLKQNKFNISEIAYMVGFNSHQYFTTSFQKHYEMSPKQFALINKKED